MITMSTLGSAGRFANQIFQYAFLRIHAKKHGLEIRTPSWIGQFLFGFTDKCTDDLLPVVHERTAYCSGVLDPNGEKSFDNHDIQGYFQYDIKYIRDNIRYFRSLFKPVHEVKQKMKCGLSKLRKEKHTIIGIHIRRTDYVKLGQDVDSIFWSTPIEWYISWLEEYWEKFENPILFVATDEPNIKSILKYFSKYPVITSQDLKMYLPQAPFYPDFYMLTQCDVMLISNSAFSFSASLLNKVCKKFYRPNLMQKKLISYSPINSERVLLLDTIRSCKIQNKIRFESKQSKIKKIKGIICKLKK